MMHYAKSAFGAMTEIRHVSRVWLPSLLVACAGLGGTGLAGCRSTPTQVAGTHAAAGDTLYGHLPGPSAAQAFTFEGVESALLDFAVVSDRGNQGAPVPALTDPEGRPVDINAFRRSAVGAATAHYEGIILMRTGNYRVAVESADATQATFYRFTHVLKFPPIEDLRMRLTAAEAKTVSITAPRGGRVLVTIGPIAGSTVEPDIRAVIDPWGGRALDASQVPQGSPLPQLVRNNDGGVTISFIAPRPGRYTVQAAAKPGREGDAAVSAHVIAPAYGRDVLHNDSRDLDYGLPGDPAPRPTAQPAPVPSVPGFPGDPDGGTPGVAAR